MNDKSPLDLLLSPVKNGGGGLHFTDRLKDAGVRITMDGKNRWRDNVFIERLWRSVKYEEIYLWAYDTVADARSGLKRYFGFYNSIRTHQARRLAAARRMRFTSRPAG